MKDYLTGKGLEIVKVVKASHPEAYWHSFIVTVNKFSDFNKIMKGEVTPPEVAVRQYYPARRKTPVLNDPRIQIPAGNVNSVFSGGNNQVHTPPATVINQAISSLASLPQTIT